MVKYGEFTIRQDNLHQWLISWQLKIHVCYLYSMAFSFSESLNPEMSYKIKDSPVIIFSLPWTSHDYTMYEPIMTCPFVFFL